MFLIFMLYALFAITFILGKEAVLLVPPVFFIGIRMIIASVLLLGFLVVTKRKIPHIAWSHAPWFAGIIIFHIYGAYVLEYISLQYLTSAKTCLLYNLSPFITALLSYLFFSEIMTARKWIGLLIGFVAFIPTLVVQTLQEEKLGEFCGFISSAELILIISITFSCIGWIFMRKLTREHEYSYFFVNTVGMLGGGILALITSAGVFDRLLGVCGISGCRENWPVLRDLMSNYPFLCSLFSLIFIGNIVCYNLYGKLLHTYSTTVLSFF